MPTDPSIAIQGWVPLLGVFATVLAAISPAIYNGWRADRNAKRAADTAQSVAKKLDETTAQTIAKLNRIEAMVDGPLTAAHAKIDRLEQHLLRTEGRIPTGPPRVYEASPSPEENPEDTGGHESAG